MISALVEDPTVLLSAAASRAGLLPDRVGVQGRSLGDFSRKVQVLPGAALRCGTVAKWVGAILNACWPALLATQCLLHLPALIKVSSHVLTGLWVFCNPVWSFGAMRRWAPPKHDEELVSSTNHCPHQHHRLATGSTLEQSCTGSEFRV